MIIPGLVSVTFRHLSPDRIIQLAADAGLRTIEWGGDVHVPDVPTARSVADACSIANIDIAAYGSYYRPGPNSDPAEFTHALACAHALGAPIIRIWAGPKGSAETTPTERAQIVAALRSAADRAGMNGIAVALEFHPKTLTDTLDSTLELLDEIGSPNVVPYWQPRDCWAVDDAVRQVEALLPRNLPTVHVFTWDRDGSRLPLASGEAMWRPVLATLASTDGPHNALLEFVPRDDESTLIREAVALHTWIAHQVLE